MYGKIKVTTFNLYLLSTTFATSFFNCSGNVERLLSYNNLTNLTLTIKIKKKHRRMSAEYKPKLIFSKQMIVFYFTYFY